MKNIQTKNRQMKNRPRVISADSHVTEPADLWTRYIEPQYRSRAPHVERGEHTDVIVCDTAPMFTVGVLHGIRFRSGETPSDGRYSDIPASGWDPAARIPEIEMDGVRAEFVYPTVAMRFWNIEDTGFGEACFRAYNTWMADFCRPYPDRFKGCGMIMLDNLEHAVQEVYRVKKLGLSGIMVALFPDDTKPYYDAHYDPFWAAAQDTALPVSLHIATERRVKPPTLIQSERSLGNQPVQYSIVGMIISGVFDRFPKLQVVSAENDAGWAGNIIERMEYYYGVARARNLSQSFRKNKLAPRHYWHNNISYTFMRDLTAMAARHIIGVDRLMWSTDYPHGDSTWPESAAVIEQHSAGLSEEERYKIFAGNAARMYGFPE